MVHPTKRPADASDALARSANNKPRHHARTGPASPIDTAPLHSSASSGSTSTRPASTPLLAHTTLNLPSQPPRSRTQQPSNLAVEVDRKLAGWLEVLSNPNLGKVIVLLPAEEAGDYSTLRGSEPDPTSDASRGGLLRRAAARKGYDVFLAQAELSREGLVEGCACAQEVEDRNEERQTRRRRREEEAELDDGPGDPYGMPDSEDEVSEDDEAGDSEDEEPDEVCECLHRFTSLQARQAKYKGYIVSLTGVGGADLDIELSELVPGPPFDERTTCRVFDHDTSRLKESWSRQALCIWPASATDAILHSCLHTTSLFALLNKSLLRLSNLSENERDIEGPGIGKLVSTICDRPDALSTTIVGVSTRLATELGFKTFYRDVFPTLKLKSLPGFHLDLSGAFAAKVANSTGPSARPTTLLAITFLKLAVDVYQPHQAYSKAGVTVTSFVREAWDLIAGALEIKHDLILKVVEAVLDKVFAVTAEGYVANALEPFLPSLRTNLRKRPRKRSPSRTSRFAHSPPRSSRGKSTASSPAGLRLTKQPGPRPPGHSSPSSATATSLTLLDPFLARLLILSSKSQPHIRREYFSTGLPNFVAGMKADLKSLDPLAPQPPSFATFPARMQEAEFTSQFKTWSKAALDPELIEPLESLRLALALKSTTHLSKITAVLAPSQLSFLPSQLPSLDLSFCNKELETTDYIAITKPWCDPLCILLIATFHRVHGDVGREGNADLRKLKTNTAIRFARKLQDKGLLEHLDLLDEARALGV